MLNKTEAQHQNQRLYDEATQQEILEALASHGSMFCGQVAKHIDKDPKETRWHLTELVSRGEAGYQWTTGRYTV